MQANLHCAWLWLSVHLHCKCFPLNYRNSLYISHNSERKFPIPQKEYKSKHFMVRKDWLYLARNQIFSGRTMPEQMTILAKMFRQFKFLNAIQIFEQIKVLCLFFRIPNNLEDRFLFTINLSYRALQYNLQCAYSFFCLRSVIYAFLVPSKIVGIPQVGSKMMMLTIEASQSTILRGKRSSTKGPKYLLGGWS